MRVVIANYAHSSCSGESHSGVHFVLPFRCDPLDCEVRMGQQLRGIPFRWILPSIQLVVCLALLWPGRVPLSLGVVESIYFYSHPTPRDTVVPDANGGHNVIVHVAPVTPKEQQPGDAAKKIADIRAKVPLALNFPVLVAELPYILVSPAKREWVPRGMPPETWRALSWPFLGILFWWSLGRGVEALRSARRSLVHPRISWIETGFAIVLLGTGLVALIGVFTTTPDDRRDLQFMTLLSGALLWGVLATVTIRARLLQRRARKRNAAAQPATDISSA